MNFLKKFYRSITKQNIWARPETAVTFRAEIMPVHPCAFRGFSAEISYFNFEIYRAQV